MTAMTDSKTTPDTTPPADTEATQADSTETETAETKAAETEATLQGPEQKPGEIGGPQGPEPTRYGDWEFKGRCSDF